MIRVQGEISSRSGCDDRHRPRASDRRLSGRPFLAADVILRLAEA
jgi:hypothetical protein